MSKDKIDTSDECFGVTLSQNNVYLKGDKMNKYVRRIFVDVTSGSYLK